ncbi:MAG: DMT family transporter [Pseudomonadota bacterium]
MHAPTSAILLKLAAAACVVGLGTCVHAAAAEAPIGQIMAMRAAISLVIVAVYGLLAVPLETLRPKRLQPHLVRGGLACVGMFLSYVAYAALPVAQAQTLAYLAPVITLPAAALLLGERLTGRVVVAVGIAFVGVLFILGVSVEMGREATIGALAGLACAAIIALIQVQIRSMTATETTLSIALSFSVIVTVVSGLTWFTGNWVPLQGPLIWWLLGAGVLGAGALVFNTEAVARAPVTLLAPLEYTGLILALVIDWTIFAHAPGPLAYMGSALITAAALLVVVKRRRAPLAGLEDADPRPR